MLYSSPQAVLTGSTAMLARRELTVTSTCPLPAPPGCVPFQKYAGTARPDTKRICGDTVLRGRWPGSYDGKVKRQTRDRGHSLMLQGPRWPVISAGGICGDQFA